EKKLVWLGVFFGAVLEDAALEVPELGLAEVSFFTCPVKEEHFSTGLHASKGEGPSTEVALPIVTLAWQVFQ
ncbi:unnamed protein product, partial [Sphenostylis stenocarpa]